MSWIRMAISGVAFLSVASVAGAQAPQSAPPQGGAPPEAGARDGQRKGTGGGMKRLFNGIELTVTQRTQIQQIMEKYKTQRESLRASGGQQDGANASRDEALHAKADELMLKSYDEYRALLNADQQKIFDQNIAAIKARMEQRQKEGPRDSRT